MTRGSTGSTLGITLSAILGLLLIVPGSIPERLEEPGHGHAEDLRVSIEAVHSHLPVHFDAAAVDAEQPCSACLLGGRTVIRAVAASVAGALPPKDAVRAAAGPWWVTKAQRRLDLSRAPPRIL